MSTDCKTGLKMCSNCMLEWDSVRVIPSSELCWNFGQYEFLPITPWPDSKPKKEPFEYCKKVQHVGYTRCKCPLFYALLYINQFTILLCSVCCYFSGGSDSCYTDGDGN